MPFVAACRRLGRRVPALPYQSIARWIIPVASARSCSARRFKAAAAPTAAAAMNTPPANGQWLTAVTSLDETVSSPDTLLTKTTIVGSLAGSSAGTAKRHVANTSWLTRKPVTSKRCSPLHRCIFRGCVRQNVVEPGIDQKIKCPRSGERSTRAKSQATFYGGTVA